MTTIVIIKANHGWDVDVTPISTKSGEPDGCTFTVVANTEQTFNVWDGRDLLIHEVQPGEYRGE